MFSSGQRKKRGNKRCSPRATAMRVEVPLWRKWYLRCTDGQATDHLTDHHHAGTVVTCATCAGNSGR